MVQRVLKKARRFEAEAKRLFSTYESSASRIITLSESYSSLAKLSIRQDELFRQSLRCVENELYRAAHVLGWAGFVDYFEEKLAADGFKKLHAAYPAWSIHKSIEDLRENVAEYQLLEAGRKLKLCSKTETKALQGLLNKRNECAHPSDYFPGLNESLGYVSELFQRIKVLHPKSL